MFLNNRGIVFFFFLFTDFSQISRLGASLTVYFFLDSDVRRHIKI